MEINQYIDHTILKATATAADVEKLCREAIEHKFYAVCVNGSYVAQAASLLKGSSVQVAAVVGFPLGAMSTKAKVFEAVDSVENGAGEIDMVINIGKAKAGDYYAVEAEISEIKKAIGPAVLKVIIETCYLNNEEKRHVCLAAKNAGANFVKTSTGFGTAGATLEDVRLMKETVGRNVKVKASGGIKDATTAKEFIAAGADRLGTSSGIEILSSNN